MIREPSFFILASLASAPLHGYGIIKTAEQLSRSRIRLSPGTLYAALDRLERDGLLSAAGDEIVDGRLRRHYRITTEGLALLKESAELFASHAKMARRELARAVES